MSIGLWLKLYAASNKGWSTGSAAEQTKSCYQPNTTSSTWTAQIWYFQYVLPLDRSLISFLNIPFTVHTNLCVILIWRHQRRSYSIYKLTCIWLPVPHNCALVVHTAWHILYISCKLCVSVRRLLLLYSVSSVSLSNVGHPRWPPRPPTTFGKSAGILQCLRV